MVRFLFMPVSPAAGTHPANVSASKAPFSAGSSSRSGLFKIPVEPLFSGIGHILFLASVVSVIGVLIFFVGIAGFQKSISSRSSQKVGPLVPPINVADVKFPSDFQRDIFLKNFQEAGKTRDYVTRYKFLQDDYLRLLGFYSADRDPKNRKILEQYAQYMINNYPEHAQESIYTVPCIDSTCGKIKFSDAVSKIKGEVDANPAIEKVLKDSLDKNFEAAALSSAKEAQFSYYQQIFQSLKGSYNKTKEGSLKQTAVELRDFIKANYSDLFGISLKYKPDLFDI